MANGEDISDWDGAKRLIASAVDSFGGLDVLVNNAGILRDRMLVNMTDAEFDAVIRVHLRGTFAPMRWAAEYWRDRVKAGETNDARIINTTSPSGIYGNVGQTNYGAAKAGIASMTVIAAMELGRYGVTVNAIAPAALTRMTENLGFGDGPAERKPDEFDPNDPDNIAPLVVWLGSADARVDHRAGLQCVRRHHQCGRGMGGRARCEQGRPLGAVGARRRDPRVGGQGGAQRQHVGQEGLVTGLRSARPFTTG